MSRTSGLVATRFVVAGLIVMGGVAMGAATAQGATILPLTRAVKGILTPQPNPIAVDARLGRVFIIPYAGSRVSVFDATGGRLRQTVPVPARPVAIAVDESSNRVFVLSDPNNGTARGSVSVLDARTGRLVRTVPVGCAPQSIAVDAVTHRAFVLNGTPDAGGIDNGGSVSVLDTTTGRVLRTIALRGYPDALAAAGTGDHVFIATSTYHAKWQTWSYGLTMYDSGNGHLLRAVVLPAGSGPFALVAEARAGRVVAVHGGRVVPCQGCTAYYSVAVSTLDGRTGAILRTVSIRPRAIAGAGLRVGALAADEGAGRVYVTTYDATTHAGRLSIIDARSGRLLRTVDAGSAPVALAVAPRLGRLLVVNGDYTRGSVVTPGGVRVLDAADGRLLRVVDGGLGNPYAVAVDDRAGLAFEPDPYSRYVGVIDVRGGRVIRALQA